MLRNSAQGTHGFCSLLFPTLRLMNWVLMLRQLLGTSIFSLQISPAPLSAQPGAGPASWHTQQAHPNPLSPDVCWSPARHKPHAPSASVGWGGFGRLPTGAEAASPLFSAPSTVLKPITMPDIQITEVDAPAESDQMSSPTGTSWWEEPPGWGQPCEG